MEDILAIILIFGGGALAVLAYSPVGRALADRMRHGEVPVSPVVDDELYEEVDRLRIQVSEMHERLDFAERLLTDRPIGTAAEKSDGSE